MAASPREGEGRTALVTGASAGLGAAFVRLLASRGHDLVLTARRRERLEALAEELAGRHGVRAVTFGADLADRGAVPELLSEIERRGLAIDVLVNNAGYGISEPYDRTEWAAQASFIEVMVTAPMALTHAFLPGMVARRYGRIVQVASLAGLLPGAAGHTLYAGAKAFLIKASQSLALELEGTGVHVSALCPGLTRTEFHAVAGTQAEVDRLPRFLWQSAEAVVAEGWAAVMAGRPVAVTGDHNRTIALLARLMPPELAFALARRRGRRKGRP